MDKKNSNQHQDNKKSADKKQTGSEKNSQSGSDKNQTMGKKHDTDQDVSGRIPERKKEVNDDPDETSKKIPHMNQKN
jgi:hypothetical protein